MYKRPVHNDIISLVFKPPPGDSRTLHGQVRLQRYALPIRCIIRINGQVFFSFFLAFREEFQIRNELVKAIYVLAVHGEESAVEGPDSDGTSCVIIPFTLSYGGV